MITRKEFENFENKKGKLFEFCLKDNKKIAIMPAGTHAQEVFKNYLEPKGIKVDFFIDNNKKGLKICGKDVISPHEVLELKEGVKIIFATNLDVYKILKTQVEPLVFESFYAGQQYCIYSINEIENPLESILECYDSYENLYNFLEDEFSRKTLDNHLKYRLNYERADLLNEIKHPEKNQYFEDEIYKISKDDFVLDSGAFTGDTLEVCLQKTGGKIGAYYAFEPDEKNFLILKERAKKYKNIYPIKKGNYIESKTIYFNCSNNSAAKIESKRAMENWLLPPEKNIVKIKVVKIDEQMKNKKVTFIKMDIEGAEREALLGAKKTIQNQKPVLAICVYHKFNDIFDLFELIQGFGVDYRYYLRHYSNYISETILYAVPK